MKNIVLGIALALFGGSILLGNVSHASYGFMTLFALACVGGGGYAVLTGVRARRNQ